MLDTLPAQGHRHRRHANPFSLQGDVDTLDCAAAFAAPKPLALDIGCGRGAFVVGLAAARPDLNVLGLELRPFLVEAGNQAIEAAGLGNAKVVRANANAQLAQLLGTTMLALVTLNFPDPWFKLRHHKRRVITPNFAGQLRDRMAKGASLHVMTDVKELARAMRQTLNRAGFVDQAGADEWPTASTTGVHSEREVWHASKGDRIWRCHFVAPH